MQLRVSFGFFARKDRWLKSGTERQVIQADLLEISPCTFATYPQTSVAARAVGDDLTRAGFYRVDPGRARAELERPLDPLLERERMQSRLRLAMMDK